MKHALLTWSVQVLTHHNQINLNSFWVFGWKLIVVIIVHLHWTHVEFQQTIEWIEHLLEVTCMSKISFCIFRSKHIHGNLDIIQHAITRGEEFTMPCLDLWNGLFNWVQIKWEGWQKNDGHLEKLLEATDWHFITMLHIPNHSASSNISDHECCPSQVHWIYLGMEMSMASVLCSSLDHSLRMFWEKKLTMLCWRKYRNFSQVIDPSTTVLATMVRRPSPETHCPWTNTPLSTVNLPLFAHLKCRCHVLSSFKNSSKKLISSALYWAICRIKSAWRSSSCSLAMICHFFTETPAHSSSL